MKKQKGNARKALGAAEATANKTSISLGNDIGIGRYTEPCAAMPEIPAQSHHSSGSGNGVVYAVHGIASWRSRINILSDEYSGCRFQFAVTPYLGSRRTRSSYSGSLPQTTVLTTPIRVLEKVPHDQVVLYEAFVRLGGKVSLYTHPVDNTRAFVQELHAAQRVLLFKEPIKSSASSSASSSSVSSPAASAPSQASITRFNREQVRAQFGFLPGGGKSLFHSSTKNHFTATELAERALRQLLEAERAVTHHRESIGTAAIGGTRQPAPMLVIPHKGGVNLSGSDHGSNPGGDTNRTDNALNKQIAQNFPTSDEHLLFDVSLVKLHSGALCAQADAQAESAISASEQVRMLATAAADDMRRAQAMLSRGNTNLKKHRAHLYRSLVSSAQSMAAVAAGSIWSHTGQPVAANVSFLVRDTIHNNPGPVDYFRDEVAASSHGYTDAIINGLSEAECADTARRALFRT